ncbi:MAG: hypothetical protein D5R97_06095 [Candidatus Syntrophonatronum acetioxidans]|uniref:Uncharacterized protein n=1 Tax=Candidatus Syntrophonatronum acetioxidans TaxID=1795816 RepID=A0A424YDH3_9FIRM|nr:MAG: hypothetical protein D5R97_06095 [Candidatus Syntrophonatronum acetioxidans]
MEAKDKEKGRDSLSVNWLVSVLIHVPEIFALNFNVNEHKFKFSYMLNQELDEEKFQNFKGVLMDNLGAFEHVFLKGSACTLVKKTKFNGLTLLEIVREIKTISMEEIQIVNSVVRDFFYEYIISEKTEKLNEFKEDLIRHEEFIKSLTINYSSSKEENIFAFRQGGKVFVFDK